MEGWRVNGWHKDSLPKGSMKGKLNSQHKNTSPNRWTEESMVATKTR